MIRTRRHNIKEGSICPAQRRSPSSSFIPGWFYGGQAAAQRETIFVFKQQLVARQC